MRVVSLPRVLSYAFFALLAFAVLWRGGKGIEATWLLAIVGNAVVLASLWKHRREKRGEMVPLALWLLVMMFVLWTVLCYVFSLTKNYGLDEVLRDATLFLLFLWTIREWGRGETTFFRRISSLLVILTILSCVGGMFIYVLQPVTRFVGSFVYYRFATDYWPNAWAEYVILTWPLLFLWTSRANSVRGRILRDAILGIVLGSLLLSYSRGGVLVFIGQAVLLALLSLKTKRLFTKQTMRSLVAVCAVAVLAFFSLNAMRGAFHPVESVAKKVTFTADEGTSSLSERWNFFRQATQLAQMRPLFGWGPYSFRFAQPRLQTGVLQTSDHPHNVFLKLAAERGVPAAVLYLAILLTVLGVGLRRLLTKDAPAYLPVIFVAATGVLAHNIIDYNLQFVGIVLPFMLFLGVLAADPDRRRAAGRTHSFRQGTELILACAILFVTVIEGGYLVVSSLGRHEEALEKKEEALLWYRRADGELFSRDLGLSTASLLLKQSAYPDAEREILRYLDGNQEDARAWRLLGNIQNLQFQFTAATRSLRQALLLGKYNDIGITKDYLQALAYQGNAKEIEQGKPVILPMLREYGDAIAKNTHFIALSSNVESYASLASLASRLYPSDAAEINVLNAKVQAEAAKVRQHFSARKAGFLW